MPIPRGGHHRNAQRAPGDLPPDDSPAPPPRQWPALSGSGPVNLHIDRVPDPAVRRDRSHPASGERRLAEPPCAHGALIA